MGAQDVLTAIKNQLQGNSALATEFSHQLTGTVSMLNISSEIIGTNTLFTTEVERGVYIGTPALGYRYIVSVVDDTHLTVNQSFGVTLDNQAINRIEIGDAFDKYEDLTLVGKTLQVEFIGSEDMETDVARSLGLGVGGNQMKVWAIYGFVVMVAFLEPDSIEARRRRILYDKMIRDAIDADLSFGNTVIGLTEMGKLTIAEAAEAEGFYYGAMPLVCYKAEVRGNR